MLKAVIDANVFVSALLNPGTASSVLNQLKMEHFQVVYPEQLIIEIQRTSTKAKLSKRIRQEELMELLELITDKGILVVPEQIPRVCRDQSDDVYLACATTANANFIVTGDNDLRSLSEHGTTKIVTPAEFLAALAS